MNFIVSTFPKISLGLRLYKDDDPVSDFSRFCGA